MNKQTLRSLGLGFLASAVLVGGFGILQGHVPVAGLNIQSIFNENNDELIASLQSENESILDERDRLESTRQTLNASLASLNESHETMQRELASLRDDNESLRDHSNSPDEEPSDSESDSDESINESDNLEDEIVEIFTINDGEASSQIANRLQEEGFIDSATDFQALIDEWGLSSYIQAGNYELNSNMSIHDIATVLTNGAYYYY